MWITLLLKYWRFGVVLALLLIASGASWYVTKNYYQAKIAAEKLEYQNHLILLQEKRKQEERKVVSEYENKKTTARAEYNILIKRLRQHYCLPRASELTGEHSAASTGNTISCQAIEDITTLMYIAQEQAEQLIACQRLSNASEN